MITWHYIKKQFMTQIKLTCFNKIVIIRELIAQHLRDKRSEN